MTTISLSFPFIYFQLCDKTNHPTIVSVAGNMIMASSFLFFGPAPFFSIEPQTSLIQGMSGLGGIGYALVIVSTFSRAHSAAIDCGLPDNIETYLMISGNDNFMQTVISKHTLTMFMRKLPSIDHKHVCFS